MVRGDQLSAILVERYGAPSQEERADHRRDEPLLAEGLPCDRAIGLRSASWSTREANLSLTLYNDWSSGLVVAMHASLR